MSEERCSRFSPFFPERLPGNPRAGQQSVRIKPGTLPPLLGDVPTISREGEEPPATLMPRQGSKGFLARPQSYDVSFRQQARPGGVGQRCPSL